VLVEAEPPPAEPTLDEVEAALEATAVVVGAADSATEPQLELF
jgi:hypothetical protein